MAASDDVVLSGEFTIRPCPRPGLWQAEVIGNDEAAHIGEGTGTTPHLALDCAVADYLDAIGERADAIR